MILGQPIQVRGHSLKVQIKPSPRGPVHLKSTDSRGEGTTKEEKNIGGDRLDYMDSLLSKWANNRLILHGWTKGVDGPKGHVALSCSLCGP